MHCISASAYRSSAPPEHAILQCCLHTTRTLLFDVYYSRRQVLPAHGEARLRGDASVSGAVHTPVPCVSDMTSPLGCGRAHASQRPRRFSSHPPTGCHCSRLSGSGVQSFEAGRKEERLAVFLASGTCLSKAVSENHGCSLNLVVRCVCCGIQVDGSNSDILVPQLRPHQSG